MPKGVSVPLHDFCRIIQGGRLGLSGNDFVPKGFPAYGAGGVNGYLATPEFDEPAVVLSAIGARCGKCFFADGKWTSLANTQLIFPDPARADCRFLWYQLNDERRWHRSGTGQPFIKPSDVKAHRVFLPPLPEQRRIAEILDKADALRAKRRTALAQLDTLTQSIFLDMFGDPATNPKGWPVRMLDALGVISTGKTPPTAEEGLFGGDIPFATPGDLDIRLESTQRTITKTGAAFTKIVRAGSALVGCIGNIGKMSKTPVATAFNQQINAVEWGDDVDDDYGIAALAFAAPQMLALASSTTVPILNKSAFSKVTIPVPPLPMQREFCRRIKAIEKLSLSHRQALARCDNLFSSLQHRAFRGDL